MRRRRTVPDVLPPPTDSVDAVGLGSRAGFPPLLPASTDNLQSHQRQDNAFLPLVQQQLVPLPPQPQQGSLVGEVFSLQQQLVPHGFSLFVCW
jgi:hypothetical protein